MFCNKIWYNLPKSIKNTLNLYNLPNELTKLLEELKIEKPTCYDSIYPNGYKKFIWYNLSRELKKLCELDDCEDSTPSILNRWIYLEGQAPSLIDFETQIGFSLINGVKDGDTITFDNVGYSIPADSELARQTISIITSATSTEHRALDENKGTIVANILTDVGFSCFSSNLGTITLNSLTNADAYGVFANNEGTLNIPNLQSVGERCFDYNQSTINAPSLTTLSSILAMANNYGTINADNLTSANHPGVFAYNSGLISIKSLTPIGSTTGLDNTTINPTSTAIFNVNIANQTNNGGQPDEDLQYAISTGATVNYF